MNDKGVQKKEILNHTKKYKQHFNPPKKKEVFRVDHLLAAAEEIKTIRNGVMTIC